MATNETELKTLVQTDTPTIKVTADTELFIPAVINTDCLGEISKTQQKLTEVKSSLSNIVETIAQNQSMVSRAAKQWGELPTWQKVAGGVTLTLATIPAALVANVGVLLAISGATLAAYTTTGIILEDHHLCNQQITENLQKGILSLADMLELTINALDKIRDKFKEEIEKFRVQNVKLTDNIDLLTQKIESLTNQVELFVEAEKKLRQVIGTLEQTNNTLLNTAGNQAHLLEANQKELEQVKKEYDRCQILLSDKIVELGGVRTSLSTEIEMSKQMVSSLEGTIEKLLNAVVPDANQRKAFQERLASFISKEESLEQFADRMSATEKELKAVKAELVQSNERYHELLDLQEKQVTRFEQLNNNVLEEQRVPNTKLASLLEKRGFYGLKQKPLAEINAFVPLVRV